MRPDDAALVLGASMRLSRLVVSDDLGTWWVKEPLAKRVHTHEKYLSGLSCPFCWGFWSGVGVLGSYALTRKHPKARGAWRFVAAALTLNEVAAHLAIRLGDVADEE